MIPNPMATPFGGIKQHINLGLAKKITRSFVGVCRDGGRTLYISPSGHALSLFFNPLNGHR